MTQNNTVRQFGSIPMPWPKIRNNAKTKPNEENGNSTHSQTSKPIETERGEHPA
jgi:hypothetical protein